MKKMRNIILRLAHILGYEIVKKEEVYVNYKNYKNLSAAYEYLLNKTSGNNLILQNETRPLLMARLQGTPPSEGYAIVEALFRTKPLEGDVCEFGVAQGETSALIANEILGTGKMLHLFDSFEGLPKPSEKDILKDDIYSLGSINAYAGTMAYPEYRVISRLKSISFPPDRYFIHKGFIEKLIETDENLPTKVSFAYVDFDFYEPTKIILSFLHDVTQIGGIIIIDDYDYFSTGAKTAVDEFIKEQDPDHKMYDILIPDKRIGCFAVLTRKS